MMDKVEIKHKPLAGTDLKKEQRNTSDSLLQS